MIIADGPQEAKVSQASAGGTCMADERACTTTNECVKSEYWCDGERDCRDSSDEQVTQLVNSLLILINATIYRTVQQNVIVNQMNIVVITIVVFKRCGKFLIIEV